MSSDSQDKLELIPNESCFLTQTTNELLDNFGAGNAAPGSGSAAALMGLLAGKLIITVCKLSVSKESLRSEWESFKYIQNQIETKIEPD